MAVPFVAVLPSTHPLAAQRAVRLAQLADSPFVLLPRTAGPPLHDQIIGLCTAAGFTHDRNPLVARLLSTISQDPPDRF
ncbi:LysR substrate-binding domain-containing protein [Streptomyces sp. NPDC087851]|uniref:LysR substrate-binding domain-containing protein n=1 Tax=Streptomyces sp. NPDC087851 TaxID=3365810 RepID=UPI0038291395